MSQITVTLAQIKKLHPCSSRFKILVKSLGGIKKYGEDTPITFEQIIESNGFEDALWALKALGPEHSSWMRHFAVDCAESVKEHMTDKRSLDALRLARRYADGFVTAEELQRAKCAAKDAAGDASWNAARDAAMAAKDAAVADAAVADAAQAAAWDAASSAAWAAKTAAWGTACTAKGAWAAKCARAARDAENAADAAVDAAYAGFEALLLEYTRTGKRVMNAQEIISKVKA